MDDLSRLLRYLNGKAISHHVTYMTDPDDGRAGRLAGAPGAEDSLLPNGRLVGMISRLDPEKDVATFLRAGVAVIKSFSDVRLVLAGDGVERGALEALAAELGIADRTRFLGDVTWVPRLVSQLTVGVLSPRSNEGLSNTILEYMAGARPVVATDCGGNRELVEHGVNGQVVPAGDHAAMADAVAGLLRDPERAGAMGRAGRARAERHAPAEIGRQFQELYARVTGGQNRQHE